MKYIMGLCAGRHEIPVQDFIFDEIPDVTDFDAMAKAADAAIPRDADELEVYVTGLTPAMLAVVNVCQGGKINLTALNYDEVSGQYIKQTVLVWRTCGFCGCRMHNRDPQCP